MKLTSVKTDNLHIIKRRRKRAIRRTLIFIVLLVSLLIILCLKLPYFNVMNVVVSNNKIVNSDEIVQSSKINKGINIFYMNLKDIQTNIQSNPYILKVDVKRKFPNTISIIVQEREAVFYTQLDDRYFVIDKKGIVLEEKTDISQMKLSNLQGFDAKSFKVGSAIPVDSTRKLQYIELITELITYNSSGVDITSVDLSNELDIKIFCKDIVIKLGNDNIKEKLNKALVIINSNNLADKKGYIDVSFEGNPVVSIENVEEKI